MKENKYEYRKYGICPSLALKKGEEGIITYVGLYPKDSWGEHDVVHYENEQGKHSFHVGDPSFTILARLELETLKGMQKTKPSIPLEELLQLRDLERQLEKEKPNYRNGNKFR